MKAVTLFILLIGLVLVLTACTTGTAHGVGNQNQDHEHDTEYILELPTEDISPSEEEALARALDDEYKARATYAQVIADYGDVRPFANIINSEEVHIRELLLLYQKYGLTPADDAWYGTVDSFDSLIEACDVGVQAEIENVALYEELFAQVDNQDIIAVFTSLQSASQEKHLPAFQRCGIHQ